MARGWAAIENGEISVASVAPTRVGAMVNFLVVGRGTLVRQQPDAAVEELWRQKRGGAQIAEVTIEIVQ